MKIEFIVKYAFRGIGQIMLQENAITGLLFLIGICYGSIYMGAGVLLASITGTITAAILNYNKQEIEKGLYGFSAALVGAATFLFLKPMLIGWLIIFLGSVCAALMQHYFITKKIAAFTLPFVLITWIILFGIKKYAPDLLLAPSPLTVLESDKYLFVFKGFGQVIFQSSLFSGILFFIAVFINSPTSAFYGFIGALISGIVAYSFSASFENIGNGLLSYNAVLCAIVFADNTFKNSIWALISVLTSLIIGFLMMKFGFTILTFPFVLASFATLVLQKNRRIPENRHNLLMK